MPALTTRVIAMIIAAVLLVGLIAFGVTQCQKRQSQAAQSRVDKGQAGAQQESGADAINAVSGAGQREAGSEALTRDNDREIRGSDGAQDRVKPGVDTAGRAALCRREVYRNDPGCKPKGPAR